MTILEKSAIIVINTNGANMKEPYRKISDNNWIITVQEHGENKELVIQFPPDAINQMGWDEGDTLIWEEIDGGRSFKLTKKETNET